MSNKRKYAAMIAAKDEIMAAIEANHEAQLGAVKDTETAILAAIARQGSAAESGNAAKRPRLEQEEAEAEQAEVAELQEENNDLKGRCEELLERNARLERECEVWDEDYDDLQKEAAALREEKLDHEDMIEALREDNRSLNEEVQAKNEEVQVKNTAIAQGDRDLRRMTKNCDELQRDLDASEGEVEAYRAEVTGLEERLAAKDQIIAQLNEELRRLRQQQSAPAQQPERSGEPRRPARRDQLSVEAVVGTPEAEEGREEGWEVSIQAVSASSNIHVLDEDTLKIPEESVRAEACQLIMSCMNDKRCSKGALCRDSLTSTTTATCIWEKACKYRSKWSHSVDVATFACERCTAGRRPCVIVKNGSPFVLPLEPELREGYNASQREYCIQADLD